MWTLWCRYQGHISAALVLGGVDSTGPHLYSVWPHGSTDKLPYVTMGSGSLAAMATFEARFKPNMEVSRPRHELLEPLVCRANVKFKRVARERLLLVQCVKYQQKCEFFGCPSGKSACISTCPKARFGCPGKRTVLSVEPWR
jgi:hypothetical protein